MAYPLGMDDAYRKRAARRRQRAKTRSGRLDSEAEKFDQDFWRSVPPGDRLALVWEMVLEYRAWRSPDAGECGLQRSVCRVERGRR